MYLKNLHIENFRGIERLDVSFRKTLNVIIGENNSGKTAILDALRICLGLGYQRREIRVRSHDFFINRYGKKSDTIRFDLTFIPDSKEERGIFIELLAANQTELELQLHVEFTCIDKNGEERIRMKYWGGENEGQRLPDALLDLFYYVHLGALRNSDRELQPGGGNRLGQLFVKLVNDVEKQKQYSEILNQVMDNDKSWKVLKSNAKQKINDHLSQTTIASNTQQIDVDFVSLEFKKIVEQLKIFLPFIGVIFKEELVELLKENKVDSNEWEKYFESPTEEDLKVRQEFVGLLTKEAFGNKTEELIAKLLKDSFHKFEVSQNGLGYNNLIFIATVLGDILERKVVEPDAFISLLIEEPEAHLHPQLQNVLFNYFVQLQSKSVQVFITSHSPTITAKTDIDSVIIIKRDNNNISATSLQSLDIENKNKNKNKKYLKRFLDVTKFKLFFADKIILIEGISEALLLPVFAKIMGKKYDIDKNSVEIVNIDGVAFEPFTELFKRNPEDNKLDMRCSVITDDDRDTGKKDGDDMPSSRAQKAKDFEGVCIQVFLAKRNLEYELFSANSEVILKCYQELHTKTNFGDTSDPEEKWTIFSEKLKSNEDKGVFAQHLAEHLQENKAVAEKFIVPDYLQDAIKWVIDGVKKETNGPAKADSQ
ncbi:MAG: AAA family ATPase [Planctomycetes bacterium]|nr:AAA family ATPase [Planctomycetota bacterium]